MTRLTTVLLTVMFAALPATPGASQGEDESSAAWLRLKDAGFAVPDGQRAGDLLLKMNALLASTDPVLRDEVAYSAAERWIVRDRRLTPEELRAVRDQWLANLRDGLGARGDDRAYKRSFSALCLSLVAAADLAVPFLSDPEYDALLEAIVEYLEKERDLRGFDSSRGWIHSAAHTADVLKFLARNPRLDVHDAELILNAVSRKLRVVHEVFQWGEADRLAQALIPIIRAYPGLFARLFEPWAADARQLWAKGPNVDPNAFARVENVKQTLRSVYSGLQIVALKNPAAQSVPDGGSAAVLGMLARMP